MLPPQLQQPLRLRPLYRHPPPAAGALQAANRRRSGPIQPALPSSRGSQPTPLLPAATPVFRPGFGESFSPRRLLKQQLHRRPGPRPVAFQHPGLIPAGRYNVPAQIPLGLQRVSGAYFPGQGQAGQQLTPAPSSLALDCSPYPLLPDQRAGCHRIDRHQPHPGQPPQGLAVHGQDGASRRQSRHGPPAQGGRKGHPIPPPENGRQRGNAGGEGRLVKPRD